MTQFFHLRWVRCSLIAGLFLFALAHLIIRGPIDHKGTLNFCDFASPWASARLWLSGENPYVISNLWDTWIGSWGSFETDHSFWLALMPPGAWVALAPLAALPAGPATVVWTLLSIFSVAAMIVAVLSLARIPAGSWMGWTLIALTVASAPVQTLVAVGQLSLPVIAMIFVALWCAREHRTLAAAALLGIATAVKPQLAAPFLAWLLLERQWRVVGYAVVASAALTIVGIVPMELRGHAWLSEWTHNVMLSTRPGSPNDPGTLNPGRAQMIDLRVWLSGFLHQRELVMVKASIISLSAAAIYVTTLLRLRGREALLSIATLGALTLLPVYHRMYDAALLLPALAWALLALGGPRRGAALATLVALSIFLIPWDLLPLIMQRTTALDSLSDTWLWHLFIFPHHALATIAVSICLLWAMWCSARQHDPGEVRGPPRPRAAKRVELASSR